MIRSKKYLLILLVLMASCSKDELIDCNCDQSFIGKLCREYRFEQSDCIGYIDYHYDSNLLLSDKYFYSKNGKLKMRVCYEYSGNHILLKESEFYSDNPALNNYSLYLHTSFDSISEKQIFINGSMVRNIKYQYDSLHRKQRVSNFSADSLTDYQEYYFDTDNLLWKISTYNYEGKLMGRRMYDYYDNNTLRITIYKDSVGYAGFELYRYHSDHSLMEVFYRDENNTVTKWVSYEYKDGRLAKKSTYDGGNNPVSSAVYKYN